MIKLLDKNTIDKIAAGEVIERPLSVVKELLDNSIDAGATAITVEIKEGGISFIRVTDNGSGIPKDQVKLAYMRHATSKLFDADGLRSIKTLGFRGEALSTIAAVSQAEMITKTASSLTGVKYVIHGGEEIEFSEVGVPDGTTIIARNLFYNTPARKKFLKSPMTEASYISDLVTRIALSHPDISFKLIINGQAKVDTAGNGNTRDTIYQLFGRDITSNLIPIDNEENGIRLTGYIGKPFISRGNRGLENYFVNGRYIKSSIVNKAIEEGYMTFVMQHKFPFTVLYIELDPEKCDVNVHPTKMEFKYDNDRELFSVITRTIREALTHKEIIPKQVEAEKTQGEQIKEKPAEPFEVARRLNSTVTKAYTSMSRSMQKPLMAEPEKMPLSEQKQHEEPKKTDMSLQKLDTESEKDPLSEQKADSSAEFEARQIPSPNKAVKKYSSSYKILEELSKGGDNAALSILKDSDVSYESSKTEGSKTESLKAETQKKEPAPKQQSLFDDDFLTEKARKKHRIIGQLFETYWLIQYEDNLYIIDQHAAHEKVKYEELMKNFDLKHVTSQMLMPAMIITVSYAEKQAILDNFDLFMRIGYDIEEFGGNEFKINSVPANLYGLHGREMFMSFVSSLMDNTGYMSNEIFVQKLAGMACKAAIKGNMSMSFKEAEALIDQLLSLENPYTCPHGRPTIISMSKYELEKKFKRIV